MPVTVPPRTPQRPSLSPATSISSLHQSSTPRKVALIAGGPDGVGYAIMSELYAQGYSVYVAGRSRSRILKAIKEIAGAGADLPSHGLLHFLELDFGNMESVAAAVRQFELREPYLNVFVNNVGICGLPWPKDAADSDVDPIVQANYVLVFVLALMLLPSLESAPGPSPPRIVHIASPAHYLFPRYVRMDMQWRWRPRRVLQWVRFAHAQLAMIHFIRMLALRNPKVLCVLVNPGLVMNANLFAVWTRLPIVGFLFWCFFELCGYLLGVPPWKAAESVLRCCTDPTMTVEKCSGKHYGSDMLVREPSKVARNMDNAAQTWIWTVHELGQRNINISS